MSQGSAKSQDVAAQTTAAASKTTPVDADELGLVDSAASYILKKLTWANLKATLFGSINGLTSKSTPVGADVIVVGDSAASFAGKKTTLTELFAQFPPVTSPVAWTPTFTGFGTVSGVTAYSWRNGSELFFEIYFTSGTPTATEARISLGFNGTDGNVTSASTYPTLSIIGTAGGDGAAGAGQQLIIPLMEVSKTYMTFGLLYGLVYPPLAKRVGNVITTSGDSVSVKGSVRIQGW